MTTSPEELRVAAAKRELIYGAIIGAGLTCIIFFGLSAWNLEHPSQYERRERCLQELMWTYHYRLPPEPEATRLINHCVTLP